MRRETSDLLSREGSRVHARSAFPFDILLVASFHKDSKAKSIALHVPNANFA